MPKAIDFNPENGELIYAEADDFQRDDAYHAAYLAGFHGEPFTLPAERNAAAACRDGYELGRAERAAYDLRQSARG